jgi:hypothetical protein
MRHDLFELIKPLYLERLRNLRNTDLCMDTVSCHTRNFLTLPGDTGAAISLQHGGGQNHWYRTHMILQIEKWREDKPLDSQRPQIARAWTCVCLGLFVRAPLASCQTITRPLQGLCTQQRITGRRTGHRDAPISCIRKDSQTDCTRVQVYKM